MMFTNHIIYFFILIALVICERMTGAGMFFSIQCGRHHIPRTPTAHAYQCTAAQSSCYVQTSNHPVCLSERFGYLWCACVCVTCRVHWRAGRRAGLCRSTSALLSIGLTIREFSISSALWVLEVLCCLYWRSSHLIDHNMFWWMDVAVNSSTLCQECRRAVFWARCCSFCTRWILFLFWRIS